MASPAASGSVAAKTGRRLIGRNLLPEIVRGVKLKNGVEPDLRRYPNSSPVPKTKTLMTNVANSSKRSCVSISTRMGAGFLLQSIAEELDHPRRAKAVGTLSRRPVWQRAVSLVGKLASK